MRQEQGSQKLLIITSDDYFPWITGTGKEYTMKKNRKRKAALLAGCTILLSSLFTGSVFAGQMGTRVQSMVTTVYFEPATAETEKNSYIIPDSSTRNLTEKDLSGLTAEQLRIARNEIFARHGVMFHHKDLQDYFESQKWYKGTVWSEAFSMMSLSYIEQANVEFIAKYESTITPPAPVATTVTVPSGSEYIIPDSNSRYLTYMDLVPLTAEQLRLARNEIYARRGRTFYDANLQAYFNSRTWYKALYTPDMFNENLLSAIETFNVQLIKDYESGLPESSAASGYVLPESSARYLTASDMAGLSADNMRKARNEIYARHGRMFADKDLDTYFRSQGWYNPTIKPEAFDEKVLSAVEQANIEFIQGYEKAYPGGVPADAASKGMNGYVLPDSSTRYLTEGDLAGLSAAQLRIARNEIYARHGRMFASKDLQDYFAGCPWYKPSIPASEFDPNSLSKIEYANIALIEEYEDCLNKKSTPAATPAPAEPTPATPITTIPIVTTPVPAATDPYTAFLQSKGYLTDTGWWTSAPETYALVDIDQDGSNELLVQGPADSEWYNTMIYTMNDEKKLVVAGGLYHYSDLEYSSYLTGVIANSMSPSIYYESREMYRMKGKELLPTGIFGKEPQFSSSSGMSVRYYYYEHFSGTSMDLSKADYEAYMGTSKAISFSKLP